MGKRLNQDRQNRLESRRMSVAVEKLAEMGYTPFYQDSTTLQFIYRDHVVTFYPYSGWATGKTIKDGRGLNNLLNQLKNTGREADKK